jgi:DNA repair exonuclease SbcCD ATPase subunit
LALLLVFLNPAFQTSGNADEKDEGKYREAHARYSTDGNPTLPHEKTFQGDWKNDPAFTADEEYVEQRKPSDRTKPSASAHFNAAKNYNQQQFAEPSTGSLTDSVKTMANKAKRGAEKLMQSLKPDTVTSTIKSGAAATKAELDDAVSTTKSQAAAAKSKVDDVTDRMQGAARGASERTAQQLSQLEHKAEGAAQDTSHFLQTQASQLGSKMEELADKAWGADQTQGAKQKANEAEKAAQRRVEQAKDWAQETAKDIQRPVNSAEASVEQSLDSDELSRKAGKMEGKIRHKIQQVGNEAEEQLKSTFGVDTEDLEGKAEAVADMGRKQVKDMKQKAEETAETAYQQGSQMANKVEEKLDSVDRNVEEVVDKASSFRDRASERLTDKASQLKREAQDLQGQIKKGQGKR